ncbi:MAG: DUF1501 domain-containing protein [Deltaproteobacteria bacterium]|nr:DUF1501 domain-containing protein [Deltaproteobacteria bacterium]
MSTPLPQLTRREVIRVGGLSVGSFFLPSALGANNVKPKSKVEPRGGADVCIFLFLKGGPSQMETFDFKEGSWTPEDFTAETITPELRMPTSVMPKLAKRHDKFAIIRSMESWEATHSRGTYYVQAGRLFSPARRSEIPSMGSVVAWETLNRRRTADFLPPFLSINMSSSELVGNGCLHRSTSPMAIRAGGKLPFVVAKDERELMARRRGLLEKLDREWREKDIGRGALLAEIDQRYNAAYPLLSNDKAATAFQLKDEDRERYGKSGVGDACVLARNVVEADAGTRFIFISHNGWDLHAKAFDKTAGNNQYKLCQGLDNALAALLDDLEARTDAQGRRLIDKTFIASMGEFGRTPGELTLNAGRDHYRYAAVGVFAGAGVKGGRIIGATDDVGGKVVDFGWHKKRPVYPEDVLATLYSTMGIDWSKKVIETPSGRPFEYVENISPKGYLEFGEVKELFA